MIINTGTTIITFLMVFLIQRTQNKESLAVQLKLNELVAAVQGASNRLINIEDLSEREARVLHRHYQELAHLAKQHGDVCDSHSFEEARSGHHAKRHAPGVKRGAPGKKPAGHEGGNGPAHNGSPARAEGPPRQPPAPPEAREEAEAVPTEFREE